MTCFSIIFDKTESIEIGRYLAGSSFAPLLWIGMSFANFRELTSGYAYVDNLQERWRNCMSYRLD